MSVRSFVVAKRPESSLIKVCYERGERYSNR